jgi:hypothetical protein
MDKPIHMHNLHYVRDGCFLQVACEYGMDIYMYICRYCAVLCSAPEC